MTSQLKIHKDILSKMDNYIENNNIPNIIFHGPTGSGKKFIINSVIDKLYNKTNINNFVMYVNCAHGKGIKFIREDLKHFSKTNIITTNDINFKTVVLVNADKLTIDAQSALRRCIEQFSHSTRFFISVENINKLLKPILSRFCDIYVPRPSTRGVVSSLYQTNIKHNGPFHRGTSKHVFKLKRIFDNECICEKNIVDVAQSIYEKGYSAQNIVTFAKTGEIPGTVRENVNELSFLFHKIKREFRNEKTLILFVLNFFFFRSNTDLENIAFN